MKCLKAVENPEEVKQSRFAPSLSGTSDSSPESLNPSPDEQRPFSERWGGEQLSIITGRIRLFCVLSLLPILRPGLRGCSSAMADGAEI